MTLDVLCVGVATVDTIATVESMPGEDERVVADPFRAAGGGPAATAAVTLARLGASVGFCGVVGDDAAGAFVREQLEAEGVDTTWLVTQAGVSTPQSLVVVTRRSSSRTIITTPSVGPPARAVPADAARWVHVDQTGYRAARTALWERSARTLLSVDGGNPIPELDLDGVDLYAPTVEALRARFPGSTGDGMRGAASAGARRVVATAGSKGSYALVEDSAVLVPPFDVPTVSTMGAGDVFHGALLAGLVQGESLVESTRRANAVAALSCRALDGRSEIPNAAATREFMAMASAAASKSEGT